MRCCGSCRNSFIIISFAWPLCVYEGGIRGLKPQLGGALSTERRSHWHSRADRMSTVGIVLVSKEMCCKNTHKKAEEGKRNRKLLVCLAVPECGAVTDLWQDMQISLRARLSEQTKIGHNRTIMSVCCTCQTKISAVWAECFHWNAHMLKCHMDN